MLSFRRAVLSDSIIYYNWANDPEVRVNSYDSKEIKYEDHLKWFKSKIEDDTYFLFIFNNSEQQQIGQIRIQLETGNDALIGISVAKEHRGKGYAKEMLKNAADYFLEIYPCKILNAYIKSTNISSKFSFEKAGFELKEIVNYKKWESFHFLKSKI